MIILSWFTLIVFVMSFIASLETVTIYGFVWGYLLGLAFTLSPLLVLYAFGRMLWAATARIRS